MLSNLADLGPHWLWGGHAFRRSSQWQLPTGSGLLDAQNSATNLALGNIWKIFNFDIYLYVLLVLDLQRDYRKEMKRKCIYRYYTHTHTRTHIQICIQCSNDWLIFIVCLHDISLQDLLTVSLCLRSWPKRAPHAKPSPWSTGCDGHVPPWSQAEGPEEPGILHLFTREKGI